MSNYTVSVALEATRDTLSPALQDANQDLNDLEQGAETAEGGMGNLTNAIVAMGVAWVANQALDMAEQLNEVGDAANDTEMVFSSLTSELGNVDQIMATLHTATGNTIDDMTLQAEASRILSLNLADNVDDLAGLVGMGEKLGVALGGTAAGGVDALTSALASGRTAGLRELGIDAEAVEKRVKELTDAGMDATKAFRQAAWEEGQKTLARLGDAALVAEGGMDKLQSRIANIQQNLGQSVNNTVDAAATTLDQLIQIVQIRSGTSEAQAQAAQQQAAMVQDLMDTNFVGISQFMGMTEFDSGEAAQNWYDAIHGAFTAIVNDPRLLKDRDALMKTLTTIPENMRGDIADEIIYTTVELSGQEQAIEQINAERAKKQEEAGRVIAQKYLFAFADTYKNTIGQVFSTINDLETGLEDTTALNAIKEQQAAVADATADVNTFRNSFDDWPTLDINNETDVGTLELMLEDAKTKFAELQDAADKGLISQEDLDNSKQILDNMQGVKDNLDRINEMGLKGLTGTDQVQAAAADLNKIILDSAKNNLTDEQFNNLKVQLEMNSGEQTQTSKMIADTIAPQIAEIAKKLGDDAAVQAENNLIAYLREAKNLGLSDTQTAQGLPNATGFWSSMGEDGTPNFEQIVGFDPSKLAESLVDPNTVQAVTDLVTNTDLIGQHVNTVRDNFVDVNTEAETLKGKMLALTQNVHVVKVKIEVEGGDQLSSFGVNPSDATRNNGGRPPGADGRTAQAA